MSDKIGDGKEKIAELDDQIRKAMRSKNVKSWRVETEDGRKKLFTLKITGEKIVMVSIKEPKTVSSSSDKPLEV
ncbi:MAG: hypothetical protein AABW88_00080 [Nanoarchaeota archaeon]